MSPPRRFRLAVIASHVIQYQAPLFREMARAPDIDLTVCFCSRWGAEAYRDREFGRELHWDVPLLDGYRHKFLRNLSPLPAASASFAGLLNPGIVGELLRQRYDAVVIPGYARASYWLACLGAWLSGTPVFFRGEAVVRPGRPWWIRFSKWLVVRLLFHGTAAFLYIGSRSREFYEAAGIGPERLFFTPYTVDNDFFIESSSQFAAQRPALRAALGIETDRPVFLFVGKLVERKRPGDLLSAFARLKDRASLVFVGDGPLRQQLEAAARRAGLTSAVFAGFQNQSQLPRFYALADALILPSSHEVSPLVLNEAMCAGLALVVSDAVPSAPDLVEPGGNGFCYPCGDVAGLSEILERLASSPGLVDRLGARSREKIRAWSHAGAIGGLRGALERWARRSAASGASALTGS